MVAAVVTACLVLLVGVLLLRRALAEPYRLSLNRVELPLPGLPKALDGFSVLHISDMHVMAEGRRERLLEGLANSREAAKADLIAFTGDYVAREGSAAGHAVRVVRRVLAGRRALGVLGNNDYNPEIPMDRMITGFRDAGLRILRNEGVHLERNGYPVYVGGTEDPVWNLHRLRDTFAGDKGTASGKAPFRVLLAHSPHPFDSPDLLDELGIGLILAGHTHGGQICLPRGIPLYPRNHHMTRYVSGVFRRGRHTMFVTRGVGVNRVPLRLFCAPEINLLVLRAV